MLELGGDADAGLGHGLSEQGFLGGVEALPGEGAEVLEEVAAEQDVVDDGGLALFRKHRFDVLFEEGGVLAGEEEVELVAGVLGEEGELRGFVERGPVEEREEVVQAGIAGGAEEELVGFREGGEGAPVGVDDAFDGGFRALGEGGGAAGADVVLGGIERPGEAAVAQRGVVRRERQHEVVAAGGISGDDVDELAGGEVGGGNADLAVRADFEVVAEDGGGGEEVEAGAAVLAGGAGCGGEIAETPAGSTLRLSFAVTTTTVSTALFDLGEVILAPAIDQQAGAGEEGAGEGFGGAAVEDVAHFIAEAAVFEVTVAGEAGLLRIGQRRGEGLQGFAGIPGVEVAAAEQGDAGAGAGAFDADDDRAGFQGGGGDEGQGGGVAREDAGGGDQQAVAFRAGGDADGEVLAIERKREVAGRQAANDEAAVFDGELVEMVAEYDGAEIAACVLGAR